MQPSRSELPFQLPDFSLVDLTFGECTLQMRLSQLTTANIARAFRLMPETIILVSDRDTVAIPQDGIFHDVDNSYTWTVEGEKSTTNMSMGLHHGSKLGKGTERWKSQSFPPSRAVLAQHAQGHSYGKHGNGTPPSWIKSIEICSLNSNNEVVAYSEHPITMDESTANVSVLQDKLSQEAFNGSAVKLLNSKNILIADAEGTQGMKFRKTGKLVKAISESDFHRLQRSKGRGKDAGPSKLNRSPVTITDSDSDVPSGIPIAKKKRKIYHIPHPPELSDSDSSPAPSVGYAAGKMKKMFVDVVGMIENINERLNTVSPEQSNKMLLKELFTCLICKQMTSEVSRPVVPPCCKSVVCCLDCITQWMTNSGVCPHCRATITVEECIPQIYKPLLDLIKE